MTGTKNARPTAPTAGRAVDSGTECKTAHASTTNDTTPAEECQMIEATS